MTFLFAFASVVSTLGCGGACADAQRAWQTDLRREQAFVGTGLTALASPDVHLGLTFSEGFLQELRELVNLALPTLETRLSAGTGTERRAAVEIRARPEVERLELVGTERNEVVLHITIDTQVVVRRPGTRREHALPGAATVVGVLELVEDETGEVVLSLRPVLRGPAAEEQVLQVTQPTGTLSASVAATVRDFVEPGVEEILSRSQPIPLLRFRDPVVAGLTIELAPAALRIYPDDHSVFVGFVTNLRPAVRGNVDAPTDVSLASLRYFVHPGVPAAALRLALAEGAIPSEYDQTGKPRPEGDIRIALDSAELSEGTFVLAFRAYTVAGSCGMDEVLASGQVALTKGSVELSASEVVAGGSAEAGARWAGAPFITRSRDILHALIDPGGVVLGDGSLLPLAPGGLILEPDRIEVLFSR